MRQPTERRNPAREAYLRDVETRIVTERPALAGRIEWDTLIYMWNQGYPPADAAAHYLKLFLKLFGG